MKEITIKEVCTRKDLKEFIYLPEKVHKNNKNWMPPIYQDEWELYNPEKNKSFNHCDTVMYLAYRNGKPVGRVMGIIHRLYNQIHNENHGRFAFMECYEDQEVVHALLQKVEQWAREKGMTKIVGPLGFSDKDPQGFQIEGFEYPPFLAAATNAPYLPLMVEKEGYVKKVDLVNYLTRVPDKLPEIYQRALKRFDLLKTFKVEVFRTKKDLKPYIVPVLELMNQTYSEIYGYVPLDDQEKKNLAKKYLPILDPHFIVMIKSGEELVAFAIAVPDMSDGIRKAKGKLFPIGFIYILSELKRSKNLLTLLGGIKKEFRNQGLDVILVLKLYEAAIKYGMQYCNSHLILEINTKMRAEWERVGGRISKKFRIYQKDLA